MRKFITRVLAVCSVAVLLTGCGAKPLEEGLEQLQAGNYEEAVDLFKEAVEKDQNPGDAYRGIGIAKWELGQYEAARNAFASALENGAEKTATIYNFLGNCEMQLENPKEALNDYSLGIACGDAGDELLQEMKYNQIVAYEQCEEWENAKTKLAEYTEAYPDDERAAKEAEFLETQD